MIKSEYVEEWLRFSKMDLDTSIYLYENMHPKPLEIICYNCQQSAEKALKAILVANGLDILKTHDLLVLYDICVKLCPKIDGLKPPCAILNRYGAQIRYPQAIEVTEAKTKIALENSEAIFTKINALFAM